MLKSILLSILLSTGVVNSTPIEPIYQVDNIVYSEEYVYNYDGTLITDSTGKPIITGVKHHVTTKEELDYWTNKNNWYKDYIYKDGSRPSDYRMR